MLEFITRLRKRWVDPKIYSILVSSQPCGCWRLWSGVNYSLEDAIAETARVFGAACPHNVPLKFGGHTVLTLDQIERAMTTSDVKVTNDGKAMDAGDEKNALMRKIIATKDAKLFEEVRPRLTPAEVSLIEDSLNRK